MADNSKQILVDISIDQLNDQFLQDSEVHIEIFNHKDLKIKKSNSKYNECTVQNNIDGEVKTSCPNGLEYNPEPLTSESHKISLSQSESVYRISTKHLYLKQNYEIRISGKSIDNCNGTSASIKDTLENETINLTDIPWMSTEMACLPSDQDAEEPQETNIQIEIPNNTFAENASVVVSITNLNDSSHDNPELHELLYRSEIIEYSVRTYLLNPGDGFMISIQGDSSDGCNRVHANTDGKLKNSVIELTELEWGSTKKACLQTHN